MDGLLILACFFLFAIGMAAIIAFAVRAATGMTAARTAFAAQNGFTPCDDETDSISHTHHLLDHRPHLSYAVMKPMKAAVDGRTVYWYQGTEAGLGAGSGPGPRPRGINDNILLETGRRSSGPAILILAPTALHKKAGALLKSVIPGLLDYEGLVPLELPADLAAGPLTMAFGPPGYSLRDLVSDREFPVIDDSAKMGIEFIKLGGRWAGFCFATVPRDFTLLRPWIDRTMERMG